MSTCSKFSKEGCNNNFHKCKVLNIEGKREGEEDKPSILVKKSIWCNLINVKAEYEINFIYNLLFYLILVFNKNSYN
jgi:hypothetical protein